MNKADLTEFVVNKGLAPTKAEAERVVEGIFNQIKSTVSAGNRVSIAGFGIFDKKAVSARKVRNPRTGETIDMAASHKVKFTVAKSFKEQVKS